MGTLGAHPPPGDRFPKHFGWRQRKAADAPYPTSREVRSPTHLTMDHAKYDFEREEA